MAVAPLAASVVIPCRGHAAVLGACVASVVAQRAPAFEVIVVDAGGDGAVAAAIGERPGVRVVANGVAMLPGDARNFGAANAIGTALLFIDADCVATPGWIVAALAGLERARMVGGAVDDGVRWHPVATIDNLMQFAAQAPGRPAGRVALMPSCNIAMRRTDFEAIGGFPATVVPAGEDGLLCERVAATWGDALRFEPAMRVRHFGRSTIAALVEHQHRFGRARAILGLAITPRQRRLGAHLAIAPAVAAKRLAYIAGCALRWRRGSLAAMLIFAPVLGVAMTAWCLGFRAGCREHAREARLGVGA